MSILDIAREQVLDLGIGLDEAQTLAVLRLPDDLLDDALALAHEVRMRWCGPEVEVEGIGRLSNTIVEEPVDWLGLQALPEDSPQTRHVALAISEEDAERGVGKRY